MVIYDLYPRGSLRGFLDPLNSILRSILVSVQHACAVNVLSQIKAFNANRRVPRRFFESLNSFPRSI